MKTLAVNGVHKSSGYDYSLYDIANALRVLPTELSLFSWAPLLDSSKLDIRNWLSERVIRAVGWLLPVGDFVDDIFTYILDTATRKRCIEALRDELTLTRPDRVIAHSLGSVLVWQALQKPLPGNWLPKRIDFIGSPLWILPFKWWAGGNDRRRGRFYNYAGSRDPVAGFGKAWIKPHIKLDGVSHDLLAYCHRLFI